MNDPSLKYHSKYLKYELLYSDVHGGNVRFVRYAGGDNVVVATVDGMAEMPATVPLSSVRRASVMSAVDRLSDADKAGIATNAKMLSNLRNPRRRK